MAEKYFQSRYLAHKYWGRRPWYAVRALIERHSAPGEIVLDSFCGSGTTLVEALAIGRRAIGVDLNPMAVFISRVTITPADTTALWRAFERLRAAVEPDIHALYARDPAEIAPKHWFPTVALPVSKFGIMSKDAGMTVADLFSRRNLAATALLRDAIQSLECGPATRDLLRFAFTAALAQFTKMIRTKKNGTGWWVNAYRIPRSYRENNVWHSYENKFDAVLRMKEETNTLLGAVSVATPECPDPDAACTLRVGSATDLSFLPDESVDYIFIDPPWAIKYFDLSVLWCSWMEFELPFEQEIFPWQEEFRTDMARALAELARVLRPGRLLTINYAARYAEVLNDWREAIEATGLEWVGAEMLGQDQLSFVQRQYDSTLKGNTLLTLRKHGDRASVALRPAAAPVTTDEMEAMVGALLAERGPLTYDAIFQAIYPAVAHRPLACDLYSVLLYGGFGYQVASEEPGAEGVWTLDEGNADPRYGNSGAMPPRMRRARPTSEPSLPFPE
ncbi:MAG: hypothetical protein HY321_05965 [Armatimonadetes bacterium]|nr:hypothetical protein [Armatimonadota bacterium]